MEPIWNSSENVIKRIFPKFNQEYAIPKTSLGYDSRINSLRDCIDSINPEVWKKVRWTINNYDFVVEDPFINRAFYKYWEIVKTFRLLENDYQTILCLAEAPGGFIQGTNYYFGQLIKKNRKKEVNEDGFMVIQKQRKLPKIISMSLNKSNPLYSSYNLPSYNTAVIKSNVTILYGKDNTGDMCNPENLEYMKEVVSEKVDFITSDGGFDEGNDFNNKEQLHYTLFFTEITYAFCFLKPGGNFIIKFFDTFTNTSLDLLWLLASSFKHFSIYKPYTSRPTNSEKYIICKNFLGANDQLLDDMKNFMKVLYNLKSSSDSDYRSFQLFDSIPELFKGTIFMINKTILDGQCLFLQKAINLSTNNDFIYNFDKIKDKTVKERSENFKNWKKKLGLP
jgi:23S rRNA U2552 (ribose-2'-O)-methylase RlmE/FtsJ